MNFIVLLLALGAEPAAGQTPFTFRQAGATGLELRDAGKPVFVYNHGMILGKGFPESMRRSSYLHPVYAPDGTVLTDDFNPDHPHHRGISWMWPEVSFQGRKGDMWELKRFCERFERFKVQEADAKQARLVIENGWYEGKLRFVKEEVEIVAHAATAGRRVLDFTLRFEAVQHPVQIAGTQEGKKGFGGFCFRFAPRDGGTAKTIIRTDKGIEKKDAVLGRHPWAQISGTFQGKPAGARIDDDPSNPGYPGNGWLLRHGFGFLNVSYPGLQPITLERSKPLVLKYRVTLFAGEGSQP